MSCSFATYHSRIVRLLSAAEIRRDAKRGDRNAQLFMLAYPQEMADKQAQEQARPRTRTVPVRHHQAAVKSVPKRWPEYDPKAEPAPKRVYVRIGANAHALHCDTWEDLQRLRKGLNLK